MTDGGRTGHRPTAGGNAPRRPGGSRQPGDPDRGALIARMLRVDHAGEYGARRIYEGQIAVLGRGPGTAAIRHMYRQELAHLKRFEALLVERRVRPSALYPLWHVAGFALGATTALLGKHAAMACTVAVEEVINDHYAAQAAKLDTDEADLKATIETFRQEECEHRDTALDQGAEQAPGYAPMSAAIKAGARLAIWLAERI